VILEFGTVFLLESCDLHILGEDLFESFEFIHMLRLGGDCGLVDSIGMEGGGGFVFISL
jgi:hypothetical protein